MCLQLARGLPPAPSRGRGREGPRAGARVPKRPWRGRGGKGFPEAPAPAEDRWGAALAAAGGLDPRAGRICQVLVRALTPPSSSAFRIGRRPGDRDSVSVGSPFGGRGGGRPSRFGGGRGVRVLRLRFSSCPRAPARRGPGSRLQLSAVRSCSAENESRGSKSPFKN